MPMDIVATKKTTPFVNHQPLVTWDLALKILVPLGLVAFCIISLQIGTFSGYLQLFSRKSYGTPLMALGAGYSLAFLIFQAALSILWWRYRPYPLFAGPMPTVTVIIPAYNEGAMVEKAIYSVAKCDYPSDRLEIFCIDDGSRDDTWSYIQRAQQAYPQLIKAIRFPENRGKREALYAGLTQGRGEYFVTVDSDSVIAPETLKQILAPLLQDPPGRSRGRQRQGL